MLNGLDLFSGGGGLAEGLHGWVRPVAYCEIEPGAQRVLLSRMARGELYAAPIWDDVRTLRGSLLPEVDIIAGGFPCQDISSLGDRAGVGGRKSGLVFEFLRLIGECRPQIVFMENVPDITVRGLDRVLLGLDALGYDARWTIVSAAEVGAPQLRERAWIMAYANRSREPQCAEGRDRPRDRAFHRRKKMGRAYGEKRAKVGEIPNRANSDAGGRTGWPAEPNVDRVAHGVADRVNRLRVLGNGVVPLCAAEAFARLSGLKSLQSTSVIK